MAKTNEKVTKKVILEAIKRVAEDGVDFGADVTPEDVLTYVDTTIAQLEAKTEKAKERAAKKRAEGDDLREKVKDLLTDDYQTVADIVAQIDDPEITNAKVVARLTALCKADLAHKVELKVDKRKVKGYAAGPAPADAE